MSAPTAGDPTPRWAAYALGVLFLAWALLPPLTMPSITLDAAEGLSWGRGWQWGYAKHPPMQAWLLETTRILLGRGSFAHVWLSAACLVLCHYAVWRAARHVVPPITAFWASALLQTVYFLNYTIPEFNPNVLQLPIFALGGLFALRALEGGKPRDWLALGLTLGIGMYAKYSVALSAVTIAGFFLLDREGRARLASPWPYLAAALALLIFTPHLVWMMGAGKPTLSYVAARAQVALGFLGRLGHLLEFALAAAGTALPALLVIGLGRGEPRLARAPAEAPKRRLVYALAFGPAAISALLALFAGFRIKGAWMAPFFDFVPLAFILLLRADATAKSWRRAAAGVAVFAAVGLGAYCGANLLRPWLSHKPMRVHFPGPQLAERVEALWAAQEPGRPLRVIIGPTYIAGPAAHFAREAPFARIDDIEAINPWAPELLVDQAGAIALWNAAQLGDDPPPDLKARHPDLMALPVISLPYQTVAPLPPVRIGIALLPPKGGPAAH